jgi:hypothetical protein
MVTELVYKTEGFALYMSVIIILEERYVHRLCVSVHCDLFAGSRSVYLQSEVTGWAGD